MVSEIARATHHLNAAETSKLRGRALAADVSPGIKSRHTELVLFWSAAERLRLLLGSALARGGITT